jgi:hypothetical protein
MYTLLVRLRKGKQGQETQPCATGSTVYRETRHTGVPEEEA